jgi:hypothetical protein
LAISLRRCGLSCHSGDAGFQFPALPVAGPEKITRDPWLSIRLEVSVVETCLFNRPSIDMEIMHLNQRAVLMDAQ